MFENVIFCIPARKGSKGIPFKNRMLLPFLLAELPKQLYKSTYVLTDDEEIIKNYERTLNVYKRSKKNASDESSTKSIIEEFIKYCNIKDKTIIMLYTTYPERTYVDICNALSFYRSNNAKSLLCKKDVKQHPFLMMYEKENNKGSQLIEHNLYRRQTYPSVFEISHFISIFEADEVKNLNLNMYNDNTIFYKINDTIDVDTEKDLKKYNENCNIDKRNPLHGNIQ